MATPNLYEREAIDLARALKSHIRGDDRTQDQLATEIGLSRSALSEQLNGAAKMPLWVFLALCMELGLDAGEWMNSAVDAIHNEWTKEGVPLDVTLKEMLAKPVSEWTPREHDIARKFPQRFQELMEAERGRKAVTRGAPKPSDDLAARRQRQADAIAKAEAEGHDPVKEGLADASYTHDDDRELDEQPGMDDEDYPDEPGPEEGA